MIVDFGWTSKIKFKRYMLFKFKQIVGVNAKTAYSKTGELQSALHFIQREIQFKNVKPQSIQQFKRI